MGGLTDWLLGTRSAGDEPRNSTSMNNPYIRPPLRVVGKAPTREEFAAWRDHPVSQMVFAGLRRTAENLKDEWIGTAWISKEDQAELLRENRTLAFAYLTLEESTYEGWCETLQLEPKDD